jgi:hypothetical protein
LDELTSEGLILKSGRNYSIAPDRFAGLSETELRDLHVAVDFYRNVLPVGILGEQIHDVITDYMRYDMCIIADDSPVFQFRYRHMQRVVDDYVVHKALMCKRDGVTADITILRKDRTDKPYKLTAVPQKIMIDWVYGRQYLTMKNQSGDFLVKNVSDIGNVEKTGEKTGTDDGALGRDRLADSWFVSLNSEKDHTAVTEVNAIFSFDPGSEDYILRRLYREKRSGTVTRVDEGRYAFQIRVSDPMEMLPWFRSFMGYVYIERSDWHDLHQKYHDCMERMRDLYGDIQEE